MTSRPVLVFEANHFRSLGIEPTDRKILVCKSEMQHRAGLEAMFAEREIWREEPGENMNAKPYPEGHYGNYLLKRAVGDFTFIQTSYAPLLKLPEHSHDKACLCFILRGVCHEVYGSRVLTCKPFSAMFRPAEEVHSDIFDNRGTRTLIVELSQEWLGRIIEFGVKFNGPVCHQGSLFAGLSARLYNEFRLADDLGALVMEGIMLELLAEMSRCHFSGSSRAAPKWLNRVKEFLRFHYREPVKLADLASVAGVHPVHLARAFRQHCHSTVGEYVRQLRVEFACRALSTSDIPLAEIALESGFASQAHFSHSFRKAMAMTPAEFRAIARLR